MNIEELQAALDKYDRVGRGLNVLPASEMVLVLAAARLVADPNIEAAARALAPTGAAEKWMPYFRDKATEAVAAALTPGDT